MDIPNWLLWPALGAWLLQALALVPGIRRLRGPDPAARTKARLNLLDSAASLLVITGLLLSMTAAESWIWLSLTGFMLLALVYAAKGLRLLRARRTPACPPPHRRRSRRLHLRPFQPERGQPLQLFLAQPRPPRTGVGQPHTE
ncbi:hypothetical protein ACFV0W_19770, partial [Streptomyces anulatus]